VQRIHIYSLLGGGCCTVDKSRLSLLGPYGLEPARLLCTWDFPGKNTGAGCHILLQGIFLTQGLNPRLLHWQLDSLPLSHLGSPSYFVTPTVNIFYNYGSVQSLSCVRLFATPWIAACQAFLSITNSQSSLKLMSIELVMPSSHLILFCPLLLLPQPLPASGSFPMSQFFAWGGQSIGVWALASVLSMNTQDWCSLLPSPVWPLPICPDSWT